MKRLMKRSAAVLVLVGLILLGTLFFLFRLVKDGSSWAGYTANLHVYSNGVLKTSTLTDRNGEVLLETNGGNYIYSDDWTTRVSSLHAVGDWRGYVAGALQNYAGDLGGYTFWNGTPDGGSELKLSLDTRLQTTAWNALNGRNGAVIVMNYETGEILCMVSSPSYDPNGEPDTSIDGLFLNRCIGATFTPGSVFKLVTLIAAQENIEDLDSRTFTCEHSIMVNGDAVNCTGYHGEQTIQEALANSCNCAFAELAMELGGEVLAEYAARLGVSGSLTLDGFTTATGRFDIAEPDTFEEAWSGCGQYNTLVSPYAMMRLCAAIANGGAVKEPTLLVGGHNGTSRLMSRAVAQFVSDCMAFDVEYEYGQSTFPGLDLCAKTGTAEVGNDQSHAWFTGFLRSGEPLAFAVMVERGGGGLAQAGTVANAVLQKAVEIYG